MIKTTTLGCLINVYVVQRKMQNTNMVLTVLQTGHRRASFPHTHHVLGSISSHSSKNFAAMIEEAKEDDRQKAKRAKKEKKEKKERKEKKKPKQQAVEKLKQRPIFPSKSATMSPAIPEVEVEEFTVSIDHIQTSVYDS